MKLFGFHNTDVRTALVRKNILFSFLIKAASVLFILWLVPVTLKCLGEYTNGVWLTISSMLIWIDQMDIGLGRGLQNKLAAALARGDRKGARMVVSNTFFMLLLIVIPAVVIINGLIMFCDAYSLLNVDAALVPDLGSALLVSVSLVCSTFVLKFIGNFYMGLQLPAVSNLLVTCGHALMLLLTYFVYYQGIRSLTAIALVNTLAPLLVYLIAYPFTFYMRYRDLAPSVSCFDFTVVKSLFAVGVRFFLIQLSGLILFMTSNLIISKILGPQEVTPYQIVYRYFSLVLTAFTIISTPFWSATTDAYERGDIAWIARSERRMTRMLGVILVGMAVMVLVSPYIYNVWIGDLAEIPFALSVFVAAYIFVIIGSMCYSNFLNGIGVLFLQLVISVSAALLFIPLTVFCTSCISHSIYGILAIMILVNLPGLVINKLQLKKIIEGKAKGVWKRK